MDHPEQKEKLETIQYTMQDLLPNNIDEVYTILSKQLDEITGRIFKDKRFTIARLEGRIATRHMSWDKAPEGWQGAEQADAAQRERHREWYKMLLWKERYRVEQWECTQLRFISVEMMRDFLQQKMEPVWDALPPWQRMVARLNFRQRWKSTLDDNWTQIQVENDALDQFRRTYHDQHFKIWLTNHLCESFRPQDIQDVFKPWREQRQKAAQPESIALLDAQGHLRRDEQVCAECRYHQRNSEEQAGACLLRSITGDGGCIFCDSS